MHSGSCILVTIRIEGIYGDQQCITISRPYLLIRDIVAIALFLLVLKQFGSSHGIPQRKLSTIYKGRITIESFKEIMKFKSLIELFTAEFSFK